MSSFPSIVIRHLTFLGPTRKPARIDFGAGLNVVYGASDTGKSFIVEAIDFMLGGKGPLRDIPERIGYDVVLLGIQCGDDTFTLRRSADGGRFRLYGGLHHDIPVELEPLHELAEQHSDRSSENLSAFLLQYCGLSGKRVRKNKLDDTLSLSFRNLARLLIVTETEITEQRSPLADGNPTADTPNFATFKLMLTGVDDSSLVARQPTPEDQTKEAQAEILDKVIADYKERLKEVANHPRELDDQLQRLETTLEEQGVQLNKSEEEYKSLSGRRRELRQRIESAEDRREEIAGLLERFSLLEQHYKSDTQRLKGIEEAGTMFGTLGKALCPLCGADPQHQNENPECAGNVDGVIAAARTEIGKIASLQAELTDTVRSLNKEASALDRSIPRAQAQLSEVVQSLAGHISPALTRMRASYAEVAQKRGDVREAIAILRGLEDLQKRREELDKTDGPAPSDSVAADLPTSSADKFAQTVQEILTAWHFPGAERVSFDLKKRDLVIGGKLRTARGKGLRAITHAAFSIGLLQYCKTQDTPHPGFVVLDSPLLAYRAPDNAEDDLSGTDLKDQFYAYLMRLGSERQVIIVENVDPTPAVAALPQTNRFTGNRTIGRFGFFEPLAEAPSAPPLV
ncbi:hypothetical protein [Pseudolabrys sp.]|uniref:hypothetical protein n=1 Tax=Pseudolabrys sp. TaxID=1960880 RepID=UPI003D10B0DF